MIHRADESVPGLLSAFEITHMMYVSVILVMVLLVYSSCE